MSLVIQIILQQRLRRQNQEVERIHQARLINQRTQRRTKKIQIKQKLRVVWVFSLK